jgi:hypothetical protein
MGYLEASLNPNPSDRKPKTTIVTTRVMLGTVLTTAAELTLPPPAFWRNKATAAL